MGKKGQEQGGRGMGRRRERREWGGGREGGNVQWSSVIES